MFSRKASLIVVLIITSVVACSMKASAQVVLANAPTVNAPVQISRMPLGSGEPGLAGFENATVVFDDVYHAPQYLPGYPTAASIWPRVITVPCTQVDGVLHCEGYNWAPAMGRGEYLYFMPVVAALPVPIPPPPPPTSMVPERSESSGDVGLKPEKAPAPRHRPNRKLREPRN